MTSEVIKKLSEAALDVRKKAYCTYSGFAVGDAVQKGEVIAELYGASAEKCRDAESVLHGAFRYGDEKTEECSLVLARVE